MKKAQVEIISVLIIIAIAAGLFSTAYLWGKPLIEKRQDKGSVERVYNSFSDVVKKIQYVANNGGEETITTGADGLWMLYPSDSLSPENNSLQFSFVSKVSPIATECPKGSGNPCGWIPLSSTNTNPTGILGIDDAFVIFGKAFQVGTEYYNITYKIWFRQLNESSFKAYKINLTSSTGARASISRNLRIFRGSVAPVKVGDMTIVFTEIKIGL